MKFGFSRLASPCFDIEGGGAGAPAGGGAPAAAAGTPPATPGGNPSAPAPGAPSSGAAPAGQPAGQPAPRQFTYQEDRSNWVPSHRIRQESERASQLARELELERNRVAALSGVTRPAAPPDPEQSAIRDQLLKVFPELAILAENKDLFGGLKELNLKETIEQLRNSHNQTWVQRGTQALNQLSESVREAYGVAGKDLSPKALQRIQRSFISELEGDDEMRGRYEAGDPSVISDFVKDFTGVVLDPYRRSQAAASQTPGQAAARRLPRGGNGQPVAPPARTLKPTDDGFHEAAFARFNQG